MGKPFSIRQRAKSFRYAIHGIVRTCKEEHNFRIHLVAASLVIALGIYFQLTANEWLWLIACITLVLSAELFNTAIEMLADETDAGHNPTIGIIKDVSAGAVLVISLGSAIIGLVVFWPYFCLIL